MEKFIEVYDNILPLGIVNTIENLVLKTNKIPLYYVDNITQESDVASPAFSNEFYSSFKGKTLKFTPTFLEVLYSLSNFKKLVIEDIIQARIFIHLPSPNPGPDIKHIDLTFPHWVCLYYINDSEGDTILFNNKGEEIKRVTPKRGRIVFFDGSIKHCSSRPSSKTRAILNFDFIGEKLL